MLWPINLSLYICSQYFCHILYQTLGVLHAVDKYGRIYTSMDAAMEGSRWTCTDTVLEMVVVELCISPKSGPNLNLQSVLSPVHESRVQLYTYPSCS